MSRAVAKTSTQKVSSKRLLSDVARTPGWQMLDLEARRFLAKLMFPRLNRISDHARNALDRALHDPRWPALPPQAQAAVLSVIGGDLGAPRKAADAVAPTVVHPPAKILHTSAKAKEVFNWNGGFHWAQRHLVRIGSHELWVVEPDVGATPGHLQAVSRETLLEALRRVPAKLLAECEGIYLNPLPIEASSTVQAANTARATRRLSEELAAFQLDVSDEQAVRGVLASALPAFAPFRFASACIRPGPRVVYFFPCDRTRSVDEIATDMTHECVHIRSFAKWGIDRASSESWTRFERDSAEDVFPPSWYGTFKTTERIAEGGALYSLTTDAERRELSGVLGNTLGHARALLHDDFDDQSC